MLEHINNTLARKNLDFRWYDDLIILYQTQLALFNSWGFFTWVFWNTHVLLFWWRLYLRTAFFRYLDYLNVLKIREKSQLSAYRHSLFWLNCRLKVFIRSEVGGVFCFTKPRISLLAIPYILPRITMFWSKPRNCSQNPQALSPYQLLSLIHFSMPPQ